MSRSSAQPGRAARARSTNRRTASYCSISAGGWLARDRAVPGWDAPDHLAGHAQRLAAGGQDAQAGTASSSASARRAAASIRCSQLSSTSRQFARAAQVGFERLLERYSPGPDQPKGSGNGRQHQVGVADGGEVNPPGAVREAALIRQPPGGRTARRVLPQPPAPVSVSRRVAAQQAADLGQLGLAADEGLSAGRAGEKQRGKGSAHACSAGSSAPARICSISARVSASGSTPSSSWRMRRQASYWARAALRCPLRARPA